MQATEGKIGRIFILKLDQDDIIPDSIENFAHEHGVKIGYVNYIGGIGSGNIVVGPESETARPIVPVTQEIKKAHETSAFGLIAPDESGKPILHFHGSLGRGNEVISGCLRKGMKVWLTGEAILYEIENAHCQRLKDKDSGLILLKLAESAVQKPVAKELVKEEERVTISTEHTSFIHLFNASIN